MNFPNWIQTWDVSVVQIVQGMQQPAVTVLFQAISLLGNPAVWIIVAAFLYWQGKENESVLLMNLVVFTAIIGNGLKEIIQRARPNPEQFTVIKEFFQGSLEKATGYGYSFPSGHTTLIASIYAYRKHFIEKKEKIFLAGAIIGVMIARVYLGWHFVTDVLAGLVLGYCIGKLNWFIEYELEDREIKLNSIKNTFILAGVALSGFLLLYLGISELAFAVLGFYFGFYLFKRMRMGHYKAKGKFVTGAIGLAILLGIAIGFKTFINPAWYFLVGLWISWGNPVLYQKWQQRKERKKWEYE